MKKIKLTETELINIINKVISEQPLSNKELDTKIGQSIGPGREIGTKTWMTPLTLDSSLFANGIDKINTQSTAYIEAINRLSLIQEKLGQNVPFNVIVTGGASAVGQKGGYKNQELADRRAQNFIKAVKNSGSFPNVIFKMAPGVVGSADIKDSKEAKAEQFVKLSFQEPGMKTPIIGPAVDNTQLVMKNSIKAAIQKLPVIDPEEKEKIRKTQKYITMCMDIPEGLAQDVQKFIDKIGGRLRSGGGFITPRPGKFPGI